MKCDLKFSLSAWSTPYQQAQGSGHVTCGNGQQAAVTVVVTGWGLTAGKFTIHGTGEISNVRSINDVFGSCTQAGAEAGVVRSGIAQVLTKGTTSLAVNGTGVGINQGLPVDKLTISPVSRR